MSKTPKNDEQVRQCLSAVDEWASSGQTRSEFAQSRGLSDAQPRAWSAHAPRGVHVWLGRCTTGLCEGPKWVLVLHLPNS